MSTKKKLREFKKQNEHLFYKTEKVAVKDILPDYDPPEGQEYAIVTYTPEGMKICNFCSKSYNLVTNEELIIPMMEAILSEFPGADVVAQSQRDSRFYVDIIFDDVSRTIGSKKQKIVDTIHPKFQITNSYDGKVKYSRDFGFWRVVCENGMSVPMGETISEGGLHTDKLDELINAELLIDTTKSYLENVREHTESYRRLMKNRVDVEERIASVLDNTPFPRRQAGAVANRISNEVKLLHVQPNDWLVYNGFNGELNHNNEFKMTISKRHEVDKEIFDFLLKSA